MINKKNVRKFMRDLVRDEMAEAYGAHGAYGPGLAEAGRKRTEAIARFVDAVLRNTPPDQLLATAEFCKIEKHQNAVDEAINLEHTS